MKHKLRLYNRRKGSLLPVVLVFLVIFAFVGLMMVTRFTGVGQLEYMEAQKDLEGYHATKAGIQRARFFLERPDDPSQAHVWSKDSKQSFHITVGGKKVDVTVEDYEAAP